MVTASLLSERCSEKRQHALQRFLSSGNVEIELIFVLERGLLIGGKEKAVRLGTHTPELLFQRNRLRRERIAIAA